VKFIDMRTLPKFAATHASIHNHFSHDCLGPLKLCQFVVSSEGGFDGSEASFG